MNSQKAQLFWSALVAIAAAAIGLHNAFVQSPSTHAFSSISPATSVDPVKDSIEIR